MKTTFLVLLTLSLFAAGLQACKRIDAALEYDGRPYFFFGHQYVGFDANNKQNYTGDVFDDMGLSVYPDAVFILAYNNLEYYFASDYFTGQANNFNVEPAVNFGGNFFRNGLDAAANLNGSTVLIKGCQMVFVNKSGYMSWPIGLNQALPCEPDAAMSQGNNMIIFKDDEMYVVTPDGIQEGMPVKTDTRYTLDDAFTLCEAGETAE